MDCTTCTKRQFLKTSAVVVGSLGLSKFCFLSDIFAATPPKLTVNVTSRCIFCNVVVTHENQDGLPNLYKSETNYNFVMNDNCSGVGQGVASVSSGQADIGTVYRVLTPEEKAAGLVETNLNRLCYAVIVNKTNPVNELSAAQTLNIFAGNIQNWKEVGGKDMDILIYKQKCGANYDYIIDQALGKAGIKKNQSRLDQAVMSVEITDIQLKKIAVQDMAITMAPSHFFDNTSKNIKIDGVLPTRASAKNGSYPFLANVSLVTRTDASDAVKKYLAFLNGTNGKKLMENGFAMDWLKVGF